MTTREHSLSHLSMRSRDRRTLWALAFGVVGGPAAWYLQLNAGYALADWPCFPGDQRMQIPLNGYHWSWPAMIAALTAGVLIALAALWVSCRILQKARAEHTGDPAHLNETGIGRTHFLALWGVMYGSGFAVATLVTAVAYIVLPRCGG